MKIIVERFQFSNKSTIGTLTTDKFSCFTLEDCDRYLEDGGEKIDGQTAIPRGTYRVIIDYSNRFKRDLPRLLDVPKFEGIRIHCGNTAEDTHGCLLVGSTYEENFVGNSKATFSRLFELMEESYDREEEIWIEIK